MPELPDVEAMRRVLEAHGLGRPVSRVQVAIPRLLQGVGPRDLEAALQGRALTATHRHGKHLFARIGEGERGWLALHFGMTGELAPVPPGAPPPPRTALLLGFADGGALALRSLRLLGAVRLVPEPRTLVEALGLGPDALDLDLPGFLARTRDRPRQAKAWLLDQHELAGVGNVYADEILFQARLHPRRRLAELDEAALRTLHRCLHRVLARAARDPAHPPRGWLLPRRRPGGRCPRCGTPLRFLRAAGRGTWICPRCQPV